MGLLSKVAALENRIRNEKGFAYVCRLFLLMLLKLNYTSEGAISSVVDFDLEHNVDEEKMLTLLCESLNENTPIHATYAMGENLYLQEDGLFLYQEKAMERFYDITWTYTSIGYSSTALVLSCDSDYCKAFLALSMVGIDYFDSDVIDGVQYLVCVVGGEQPTVLSLSDWACLMESCYKEKEV